MAAHASLRLRSTPDFEKWGGMVLSVSRSSKTLPTIPSRLACRWRRSLVLWVRQVAAEPGFSHRNVVASGFRRHRSNCPQPSLVHSRGFCYMQPRRRKSALPRCGRGGIGRRAALRSLWGNPWKFESSRPHQKNPAPAGFFVSNHMIGPVGAGGLLPGYLEIRHFSCAVENGLGDPLMLRFAWRSSVKRAGSDALAQSGWHGRHEGSGRFFWSAISSLLLMQSSRPW